MLWPLLTQGEEEGDEAEEAQRLDHLLHPGLSRQQRQLRHVPRPRRILRPRVPGQRLIVAAPGDV